MLSIVISWCVFPCLRRPLIVGRQWSITLSASWRPQSTRFSFSIDWTWFSPISNWTQNVQASIQTGSCRRIYGTPSRPAEKPPEESQRVQKTNVDSLHVQHSPRTTVSQEDRDSQNFKTPTVRRVKSNDKTSTARPPARVRTGVREPPVNKQRNPERASVTIQNLRPPSKEFRGPPSSRGLVCQVLRLIMSTMTQDAIQRQARELPTEATDSWPSPARVSACRSTQGKLLNIIWIVICDAVWHWKVLVPWFLDYHDYHYYYYYHYYHYYY